MRIFRIALVAILLAGLLMPTYITAASLPPRYSLERRESPCPVFMLTWQIAKPNGIVLLIGMMCLSPRQLEDMKDGKVPQTDSGHNRPRSYGP